MATFKICGIFLAVKELFSLATPQNTAKETSKSYRNKMRSVTQVIKSTDMHYFWLLTCATRLYYGYIMKAGKSRNRQSKRRE